MENNTTFGLPENVFFCKKCNLSNQKPTSINEFTHGPLTKQVGIIFDKNQICEACRSVSLKFNDKIDWDLREKELIELCKKLKKFKGPYNCLVPGSGGKDSSYQASILKNKYRASAEWRVQCRQCIGPSASSSQRLRPPFGRYSWDRNSA